MNDIISTIYNQFGKRAFYMIGAKNLIATNDHTLRFRFMKSQGTKATMCEIELDEGTDTYTMRFFRRIPAKRNRVTVNGITMSLITEFEKLENYGNEIKVLFFSDLLETFERATGLYTSL